MATNGYTLWVADQGLRTGLPQNEIKTGGAGLFESIYGDPERLRLFLGAMTGLSMGASQAIAEKFSWQDYQTVVDVGGAQGGLLVQLCLAHPHLTGTKWDLPVVGPIFEEYTASHGLTNRLSFHPGVFSTNLVIGGCDHDGAYLARLEPRRKTYAAR